MTIIGVNFSDLVALYEYGRIQEGEVEFVKSPPTCSSLAKIQKEIDSNLPADFITFAKLCDPYTTYFSLIGDDADLAGTLYEPHVIFLYKTFPGEYVHLSQPRLGRELVFERKNPDGPIFNIQNAYGEPDKIEVASSFRHFLEDFVISLALGNQNFDIGRKNARALAEREAYVMSILKKY